MTDSDPRTQAFSDEQASLYVLDLLETHERQSFERRLRSDADLRRTVHGLQSALEAEVFNDPAPVAPARIWGKIQERTRSDGARVLRFPMRLSRWAPRLAAMAACLALGAFLHSLWSGGGPSGPPRVGVASAPGSVTSPLTRGAEAASRVRSNPEASPAADSLTPSSGGAVDPVHGAESSVLVSDDGWESRNAALQGRIRGLSAQVAELTQQVQQLSLIPSGVSRLHIFPLGMAGLPSSTSLPAVEGVNRTNSLAESLARMAGERMAQALVPAVVAGAGQDSSVSPGPMGAAGAGLPSGVDPVAKVALVPAQPAAMESPATPVSGASPGLASVSVTDPPMARAASVANPPPQGLAPIVFSAPDSGVHAMAVPTAPAGGQYQLWSRAADGTVSSLGVMTPSGSPVSVVTFERTSVEGLFMSLEPVGGSLQPTGPLVGSGQNPVLPGLGRP